MPLWSPYVRCWGQSRKHLLLASISPFDPKRTFSALFDHLVGGHKQGLWNSEAEYLRGLEIDD
jgi:hypothetical protein